MPSEVQWRGGNTTQNNNFTGAEREVSVNEDTHSLRVHDGTTAGGYELARADLSNAVGIVSITASGDVTADGFVKVGGSSTEFLKADGSVDSTVYLSSYTETDTLDSVTDRGNVTTNGISVGVVTASGGNFSGIVSATGGFNIGISSAGTPVTTGPITTLNFVGAGNTFALNGTTIDISIQGGGGTGGGGESFWGRSTLGIHTLSNVGIATTNPIQRLQVGVGTNVVVVDEQGEVGIGTTNPTSKLHVVGDINLDDGGTFTTTLQCITPTANRVVSVPDATGTLALVAGSSGQVTYNLAGIQTGSPNLLFDGTIFTPSRVAAGICSVTSAGASNLSPGHFNGTWFTGGTATSTKPMFLIEPAGTTSTNWSTNGTGLGVNAASGFAGNLLDLQVNGTRVFGVDAVGNILNATRILNASGGIGIFEGGTVSSQTVFLRATPGRVTVSSAGRFSFSVGNNAGSTEDTGINLDAANTLAQRNSTNAQAFRIYNTFTSATNFERLNVRWTSNEAIIDTEAGSIGTARNLSLGTNGITRISIAATTGDISIVDSENIILGITTGTKIGTATTQKLGFYNATPVVQPSEVTDLTTTATTGSLPTPDGTVTIANAASPTNAELLEYCVELEAKLEAALSRLRDLGLIAS